MKQARTAQFKVALSDELRARIEAASQAEGIPIAAWIRRTVEQQFAQATDADPQTRALLDGIAAMPYEVELETNAKWYEHAGAWRTLRAAILAKLQRLKPEGRETFGERPRQTMPGEDDPQAIGEWIEYQLHETPDFSRSELRQALERSYKELIRLHFEHEAKEGAVWLKERERREPKK